MVQCRLSALLPSSAGGMADCLHRQSRPHQRLAGAAAAAACRPQSRRMRAARRSAAAGAAAAGCTWWVVQAALLLGAQSPSGGYVEAGPGRPGRAGWRSNGAARVYESRDHQCLRAPRAGIRLRARRPARVCCAGRGAPGSSARQEAGVFRSEAGIRPEESTGTLHSCPVTVRPRPGRPG
jgi:hypothetical protein